MSNDPIKQATTASAWKQKGGKLPYPTDMPSGNVALVKIPGADLFFKEGMIPNSLKSTVQEAINKGEAPDMNKFQEDNEDNLGLIQDIIRLANAITVHAVVDPQVLSNLYSNADLAAGLCTSEQVGTEIPENARDQALLYVDEVDLEDKMFIMQLAFGGTRDLDVFRKGLEGDVESVPAGKAVPKPAKRAGRTTPKKS